MKMQHITEIDALIRDNGTLLKGRSIEMRERLRLEEEVAQISQERNFLQESVDTLAEENSALKAENERRRSDGEALLQKYMHLVDEKDELKVQNHRLRQDAERYQGIRQLLGYVQDGSSTTVEIFQDDATRTFYLRLDDKSYVYADCFGTLIDLAMGKAKPAPVSKQAQELIKGQMQARATANAYYKDHPEERPVCGGPEDFGEND